MYASTLPRSNWLRRASIRLAWYHHMPASGFFLCMQKSFYWPRAQAVEPLLTCDTSTDAYSRGVVPFGGQRTIFSHLNPQNPQKHHFWAHTMESLCKIHTCIPITAWSIEIRCWNLARCLTLPSTLSPRKIFSVRQGADSPHIKF